MSLEGKSPEEIEALAMLAQGLASNPKTRNGFLRLTKTANPDTAIPEIDIPNQIGGLMAEPLKRLEAAEAALAQRALEDRVRAQRKEAGISEDELPAVERFMVDNRIADHKSAKKFLDQQNRLAEPTPASTGTGMRRFGAPVMPDLKATGGDIRAHTYNAAYAAIDELRGRRLPH